MAITEVIKYEGDNSTFVWKHPSEDFNTMSQLIVHQSQEAIFFLNGQALDSFGPGRHTLKTQNIPLLTNKLFGKITDGESPFHAEVYFVNLTEQMAIKWGTDNKVNFVDPCNNDYVFPIGACGEMNLRIENPRKLLTKIVGTESILDQVSLTRYLKAPLMTHIKTLLPRTLREKKVSIFEIDEHLSEFSLIIKEKLNAEFQDYGVVLEKFWITTIIKPEDDATYRKIKEIRGREITASIDARITQELSLIGHSTEIEKKKMDIDIKRYEQEQLGYTYQQKEGFDVMKRMAENEGAGNDIRNSAMGIGMGFKMGDAFGEIFNNIASDTIKNNENTKNEANVANVIEKEPSEKEKEEITAAVKTVKFCQDCGAEIDRNSKFCCECGSPQTKPKCSNCNYEFTNDKPFCPECGTKRGE